MRTGTPSEITLDPRGHPSEFMAPKKRMIWVIKKVISFSEQSNFRVEGVFKFSLAHVPQLTQKSYYATGREILCLKYPLVTPQTCNAQEHASTQGHM